MPMLWKRTLIEHHEVWKDYTTEDPILVTKKKKTMKVPNNKFLLKKNTKNKKQLFRCCACLHRICDSVS